LRIAVNLSATVAKIRLVPIAHHSDEAGLLGATHLMHS
jgi:predicted NBD/HSP70 family sugar kinase